VDLSLHKAIHYESKKGYETLSEDWTGSAVCADSFGFGLRVFYQRLRIKRYNLFNKLSSEKDVYELVKTDTLNRDVEASIKILILLSPAVMEIKIKPMTLVQMLSQIAGIFGFAQLAIFLLKFYNTKELLRRKKILAFNECVNERNHFANWFSLAGACGHDPNLKKAV